LRTTFEDVDKLSSSAETVLRVTCVMKLPWFRSTDAGVDCRRIPVLAVVGYVLLVASWVMATQPFDSPDEQAHYIRAAGMSRGVVAPRLDRVALRDAGIDPSAGTPTQRMWLARTMRGAEMETRALPAGMRCVPHTGRGSRCIVPTWVGTYSPVGYVAPALVAGSAGRAVQGDRLGRIADALIVLVLLAWSIQLAWRRGSPAALAGVVVAVTPMTLFTGSMLNPSGLEIAAAVLLATASASLPARQDRRGAWLAVAVGGALLATTRSLGPVFVAADLLAVFAMTGGRSAPALVRSRSAALSLGVVFVAVLAGRMWETRHGLSPHVAIASAVPNLRAGMSGLPEVLRQAIGDFGWLTAPVSVPTALAWLALLLALIAPALRLAPSRERVVLLGSVLANLVFPALLYAEMLPTGFGPQGRYVLPMLVLIPIVAGELCTRHADRLRAVSRGCIALVPALAGVLHFVAWRTAQQADGSWSPPLGAATWNACALAGALALIATSILLHRANEAPNGLERAEQRYPGAPLNLESTQAHAAI
jgi:hypothetical protein